MVDRLESILNDLIEQGRFQDCIDTLNRINNVPALEELVEKYESRLYGLIGPMIALVCMDCDDEYIQEFVGRQGYNNLEIVKWKSNEDSYEDMLDYLKTSQCEYVTFLVPNVVVLEGKLGMQAGILDKMIDGDMVICEHNHIEPIEDQVIAHFTKLYSGISGDMIYDGYELLKTVVENGENIFGNLSCMMIRKEQLLKISYNDIAIEGLSAPDMYRLLFYLNIIKNNKFLIQPKEMVSIICSENKEDKRKYTDYDKIIKQLGLDSLKKKAVNVEKLNLEKKITFIYTDKGEYYNVLPIANEAEKRGYEVEFTDILDKKCNIGVYCQHNCYPENSDFSVVLMHDVSQGQLRWPNIWQIENWNKFDIGVLMGPQWADRWSKSACSKWPLTKRGVYEFGYPKSDYANSVEIIERVKTLKEKYNLKYNVSVLYAPSWENDGKEDDFVNACKDLDVNILIKQAHWAKEYQQIIDNIDEQRRMHEGKYDNLYYIEPEENIMVALAMCDLIVSDESSVMGEGLIFLKPSIAVSDWLIPDCTPSRYASAKFDYVYKCNKDELKDKVIEIMNNYSSYEKKLENERNSIFGNAGQVCKSIMDAVDYYTGNGSDESFKKLQVHSKYEKIKLWN